MKTDFKTRRLQHWAPPGFDVKKEIHLFAGLHAGAVTFFLMTFLVRFQDAYQKLFWIHGNTKVLNPDRTMAEFTELTEYSFAGFAIAALCMLGYIFIHYRYHWQDSMSIYLMKRLPDKMELHRRCLTLPLMASAATLLMAAALAAASFAVYMLATPESALPADQLNFFRRGIL